MKLSNSILSIPKNNIILSSSARFSRHWKFFSHSLWIGDARAPDKLYSVWTVIQLLFHQSNTIINPTWEHLQSTPTIVHSPIKPAFISVKERLYSEIQHAFRNISMHLFPSVKGASFSVIGLQWLFSLKMFQKSCTISELRPKTSGVQKTPNLIETDISLENWTYQQTYM